MDQKIEFSRTEEDRLTQQQDRQIAQLIADTYRIDFGGRSYCHQRHHMRYLAHCDKRLVGHLAVLLRSVRLGNRRLTICGIAEVATDQEFRKLGIASRLLKDALSDARESIAEFAVLFGTENIYHKAGFRSYQNPMIAVDLTDGVSKRPYAVTNQPLMVLSVKNDLWDEKAELDLLGSVF